MSEQFEMIAKTFQGLEEILAEELTALGANDVQIGRRMVSFTGDKEMMYKANFCLRTAIRILKPIKNFKAKDADEVYDQIKAIDWENILDVNKTFAVDAVVFSEEFRHSKFVSYKVKDAIVDYFRELNGKLIEGQYEKNFDSVVDRSHDTILDYKISEIIDFAKQVPIEEISICREAIGMNKIIAEQGYKPGVGENFGNGILEIPWPSPITKAKSYAAAASDARMQGLEYPTMSCATSGNVGITCSMPLISMGESLGKSEEEIMRALAASFLLCVQMKSLIGRLSMFCACALASSVGIAGGMVMLLGGGTKEVDGAIRNVVGSVFGILCDGAKHGCALKLSMSSGVAIESSYMAMNGHFVKGGDGFVCNTADETVRLVGRMAKEGTAGADQTMCRLLYERNKIDSAKPSQMRCV